MSSWQLLVRRKTAAEYNTENPVLEKEEIGLETDSGKYKIGDGSTRWKVLPYSSYLMVKPSDDPGNIITFGSDLGLFTAGVKISTDPDNALKLGTDSGVYVSATENKITISADSNNIIKTGSDGGLFVAVAPSNVPVSPQPGNMLESKEDGLYVKLISDDEVAAIAGASDRYDEVELTRNTEGVITGYSFKKRFEGKSVSGTATVNRDANDNVTSIVEVYTAGSEEITETTSIVYTDTTISKMVSTITRA